MKQQNHFQHSAEYPYHLSVGAVVLNDNDEVAVHYFSSVSRGGRTYTDIYILVRETLELNESLEEALGRGLAEEMGITATLISYLGPIVAQTPTDSDDSKVFEKTTLYFQLRLDSQDVSSRLKDDPEADSQIQWHKIPFLIDKMKSQSARYPERGDIDESSILERAVKDS